MIPRQILDRRRHLMNARSFGRFNGLGFVLFPSCSACRTVTEPLIGMILTLGLFLTLTAR